MENILKPYLASFLHSRAHHLKYILPKNGKAFVKRDDELGFAISGSKLRKYQSLLPEMLKNNIKKKIKFWSFNNFKESKHIDLTKK